MDERILRYGAMFAALGHEVRLAVVRLLLSAYPRGMVAGEIQEELGIPGSTLSHHLSALEGEGLVRQEREGRYVRYRADAEELRDLLAFLYAECCTRSRVVPAASLKKVPSRLGQRSDAGSRGR